MSEPEREENLKRIVDECLLSATAQTVLDLYQAVQAAAKTQNVPFDINVVLEHWWSLARTGVVAVSVAQQGVVTYNLKVPAFILTGRGRATLESRDASPHNKNKYVEAIRRRVTTVDGVILSYVEEAVQAWAAGLSRSSAVMLGCACEKLILGLAETISKSNCGAWSTKIGKKLAKRAFISELFGDVRDCIIELLDQKKLPRELGDVVDRKLSAVFDYARVLRNQSGHPTGASVTQEDAEAGLLLFPGFCELTDKLAAEIAKIP